VRAVGPAHLARLGAVVAVAAVLALLPQLVSDFRAYQFSLVGIYFISILGLNILTGYSGQISLGHGAFMGVGAYTTAILVSKYDVPELWTIPIAGLVAGVAGFLFGFPALRLTGVYLALATFGLAVAFISLVGSFHFESFTGGGGGIALGVPETRYYLTWGIAGGLFVAAWLLLRGRLGLAFRAVRDAPIAAVSAGVNLAAVKTLAFGIAAAYAGVAGSLLAIALAFVNPFTFPVSLSILLVTGVVLGGLGSLSGAIFGALFIQFAPIYAERISNQAPSVIYGLILLAVLFLMPRGVAGLLRDLPRLVREAPARTRDVPRTLKLLTGKRYSRSN
jgi:branched-chain amino acid transport system permease protein